MFELKFFQDVGGQLFYLPRAVLVAVLLMMAWLFIQDNKGQVKVRLLKLLRQGWKAAFFFYLSFMITSMVLARRKTNPYSLALSHFFFCKNMRVNWYLVENTLLFVVFSFLFLQAFQPKKPWKAALLVSAGTTLFIELSQLLFWLGWFQFSDMLYNIIGGMIGCVIWIGLRNLKGKGNLFGKRTRK